MGLATVLVKAPFSIRSQILLVLLDAIATGFLFLFVVSQCLVRPSLV